MPDHLTEATLVICTGHNLSIALLDGGKVVAEQHTQLAMGHAEALMPAIKDMLVPYGGPQCPVQKIVVEKGPGSFTGLRIGLAAARSLSIAWNVPVVGIRSTELVALEERASDRTDELLVLLGAPRGQIWAEGFGEGGISTKLAPISLTVEQAQTMANEWPLVAGTGLRLIDKEGNAASPRAAAYAYYKDEAVQDAELLYVRAENVYHPY